METWELGLEGKWLTRFCEEKENQAERQGRFLSLRASGRFPGSAYGDLRQQGNPARFRSGPTHTVNLGMTLPCAAVRTLATSGAFGGMLHETLLRCVRLNPFVHRCPQLGIFSRFRVVWSVGRDCPFAWDQKEPDLQMRQARYRVSPRRSEWLRFALIHLSGCSLSKTGRSDPVVLWSVSYPAPTGVLACIPLREPRNSATFGDRPPAGGISEVGRDRTQRATTQRATRKAVHLR